MGSSAKTVDSSDKYVPSAGEQPSIDAGMQQMLSLFQNPQGMYPGQTFVGASPYTQAAIGGMAGTAPQLHNQSQQFANAWGRGLNASDAANNPYVNSMANTIQEQSNQNLKQNIFPAIQQGAIQNSGGAMNLGRQGVAQGTAAGQAQQGVDWAKSNLYSQANQAGLAHEQGMMGQSGNLATSMGKPWEAMSQAGAGVEGYQGKALQDAMTRYGFSNQQANTMMDQLIGRLGGMRYGTQVNSQVNPNYQSPLTSALQIGMGVASLPFGGAPGAAMSLGGAGASKMMGGKSP